MKKNSDSMKMLEITDEELGCGGWAKVKVAKLKVTAKCLHDQLVFDYHQKQFKREIDVAARVSHPNLLQFLSPYLVLNKSAALVIWYAVYVPRVYIIINPRHAFSARVMVLDL